MITLRAESLAFGYGLHQVLEGIDLEARPGEVTAIVGPNGAGKTTLLKLFAGLLQPQQGQVFLGERRLSDLDRREIARSIALSPQMERPAWRLTVHETVLLGRAPHRGWFLPYTAVDRRAAARAIETLGLESLAERPITELSGGELRRVLFARILAHEPRVVLLDEPTSHLDLRHQEEVSRSFRALARDEGAAVVTTLHDLNQTAAHADRVALLQDRRLRAFGSPEEVLTAENIEAAYGIAVAVAEHPGSGRLWITPLGDGDRRDFSENRQK